METECISKNNELNKEIIQWGCKCLLSLGFTLKSNIPENVRSTPWSYVVRFETSAGYIYLKHTPKLIALEAIIIQILHKQFHASVPIVIANNSELNCFLMKDAGRPLREILKQKFDEALLCKTINQFTSLQLAVADRVDIFLEIGVPDWRLNKFPELYTKTISQKDLLIEDGLSEMQISELETLLPKISNLCKKLSDYSIKQTIVQPDFNDNNTLIDVTSQNITIIDLGEISISHPFFSLLNCLQQIKKHHAVTNNDERYLIIKNAALKNYINFESKKNLLAAFEIAQVLWPIYDVLAQYRLMQTCGREQLMSFQHGKLSAMLKELIALCKPH